MTETQKLLKYQVQYLKNKEVYQKAFKDQDWEKVEEVEDDFLEAERELVQWGLNQTVLSGRFTQEQADQLLRDMSYEQYQKSAEMTSRVVHI